MIDNKTDLFKAATEAKQKREAIEEAENLQEKINIDKQERKKRKSMTKAAIAKRQKEARKRFILTFVSGALAGSLATIGIIGAAHKIERGIKINEAYKNLKGQAQERLVEEGLAVKDEKGKVTILDNSVSDYECLDLTNASQLELHIYYDTLGSEEFDDAIQTVSYNNGVYYYTGLEQWRTINGYINKGTKKADINEQYAAMQDDILKAYDNNCEGIIRTTEEITNNQGRGH